MGLICIPLVAVYLHIPPPQLSPALQKWHSAGQVFYFRGRKVFYRGQSAGGGCKSVCADFYLHNPVIDMGCVGGLTAPFLHHLLL